MKAQKEDETQAEWQSPCADGWEDFNLAEISFASRIKGRIITPNFSNLQSRKNQDIFDKQKLILESIISLSQHTAQESHESIRKLHLSPDGQEDLPALNGRLKSVDEETGLQMSNRFLFPHNSAKQEFLEQKEYQSQSKIFYKKKHPEDLQNDNPERNIQRLLQDIEMLSLKINQNKCERQEQQEAWIQKQKSLGQKLTNQDLLITGYMRQIKILEDENRQLKKQRERMVQEQERELFCAETKKKSGSERIISSQEDKRSAWMNLPIPQNQKKSISSIQAKATNADKQRQQIQVFQLLNLLRTQMTQGQRNLLSFNIASIL